MALPGVLLPLAVLAIGDRCQDAGDRSADEPVGRETRMTHNDQPDASDETSEGEGNDHAKV